MRVHGKTCTLEHWITWLYIIPQRLSSFSSFLLSFSFFLIIFFYDSNLLIPFDFFSFFLQFFHTHKYNNKRSWIYKKGSRKKKGIYLFTLDLELFRIGEVMWSLFSIFETSFGGGFCIGAVFDNGGSMLWFGCDSVWLLIFGFRNYSFCCRFLLILFCVLKSWLVLWWILIRQILPLLPVSHPF